SSGRMRYSMVITTGPVRCSTGTAVSGSFHVRNGSRFRSSDFVIGRRMPSAALASSTTAAVSKGGPNPSAAAATPHSQLPPAMPANAAIWYRDKARATTQRGADIWTVTLNVESASTHPAPASSSAAIVATSTVLNPATTAATAKA